MKIHEGDTPKPVVKNAADLLAKDALECYEVQKQCGDLGRRIEALQDGLTKQIMGCLERKEIEGDACYETPFGMLVIMGGKNGRTPLVAVLPVRKTEPFPF